MTSAGSDQPVSPGLDASDFSEYLAEGDAVTVTTRTLRRVASPSLSVDDIYELADVIDGEMAAGAAGVVVAQGTDTLEESSYLLDLLLDHPRPVVVTGAMRAATAAGADGPANLRDAVTVAASDRHLGGVTVVFGGEVHAARSVSKTHAFLPAAFSSGRGPLGWVVEGRLECDVRACGPSPVIGRGRRSVSPTVPIITLGMGDDGVLLRCVGNADAVVIEGLGAGHAPQWLVEDITQLAARVPVVMTSRTRSGSMLRSTYGYAGGEIDLRARGVHSAGPLSSIKARMLIIALFNSGVHDIGAALAELEPRL